MGSSKSEVARASGFFLGAGWVCLVLWIRTGSAWALVAAAAGVCGAAAYAKGWQGRALAILLAAATVVGFAGMAGERRFGEGWEEYRGARHRTAAQVAEAEFGALAEGGDRAVGRLARAAGASRSRAGLQDSVSAVLAQPGITAAAVFGEDGALRVWGGSHHGRVPESVLGGGRRYLSGTTLFSYLYFAEPVPGGGTAVTASLVRSDLPEPFSEGLGDFVSRVREKTGERITVSAVSAPGPSEAAPDEISWQITIRGPVELLAAHRRHWNRWAAALLAVGWLVAFAGASLRPLALLLPVAAAALLPLEDFFLSGYLTDDDAFRLPGLFPWSLGRVLAVSCAALPLVILGAARWRPAPWAAPLIVAIAFPLVLFGFDRGASNELLGTSTASWIVFQAALTGVLALAAGVALACRCSVRARGGLTTAALGGIVAIAVGLAMSFGVRSGFVPPPIAGALWALPALVLLVGLEGRSPASYARWLGALVLAGTAALPFAWSMRTEARKAVAEERMDLLGVVVDPELDAVLGRAMDEAEMLADRGAGEIDILYHAWSESGLGNRGVPVFLTLWSPDGTPTQELNLGATGERPLWVEQMFPALHASGSKQYLAPLEARGSHLASVSLAGGRLLTATVPPRRTLAAPSALGPLFASMEGSSAQDFLTLVRLEDEAPPDPRTVEWSRNDEGWQAETVVSYPDGPHLVSHVISIPNFWVMLARAVLVFAPTAVAVSLLWLFAAEVSGVRLAARKNWHGFSASFRFRVTVMLFGFFLLSSVLFWVLANTTLAGASERTATALAQRVVSQIAEAYLEEGGSMESLARRVGADLLEYRNGELVGGSVDELIELGLYESWVDPAIHRALESGRTLDASTVASLGDWQYVVAYRRLPDADIVAAPVPLRAGATALRRRDVADLLLAALVLSPILSLVLAFFVGRSLARPLRELRIASDRVGAGNLAVGLPEDRVDEFGTVFAAFNRMVLRLDETRQELVRTTRRTRAIVKDVPTGVVAVNASGRVTVVNPQAQSLLETPLEPGDPLPKQHYAGDLAAWLEGRGRSEAPDASRVFEWGGQRIRGRVRRISHEGYPGGVVVNLEDVTDELRSERILAWGEMAKQAAHEMRNPLTPITLSIQHLHRAWTDRRPDFSRILDTNVEMILGEIDRLAAIARSFLRLASPGTGNEEPVAAADAEAVVREVINLYRGGGETRIRCVGPLPNVLCRPDEFKEVLLNLIENSRMAMPEGGEVRIWAEEAEGDEAECVLVVEDEGAGIPSALLPRIFEPQFSTRSKGTGLGLAIVRRLVESWGGSVDVESTAGKGTRVRLRLETEEAQ